MTVRQSQSALGHQVAKPLCHLCESRSNIRSLVARLIASYRRICLLRHPVAGLQQVSWLGH